MKISTNGKMRQRQFQKLVEQTAWTQAETARQLRVTPNYISMLMRGRSIPSQSLVAFLEFRVRQSPARARLELLLQPYERLSSEDQSKVATIMATVIECFAKE